ncbi:GAF and ANTAR domain-containing protein [Pseudonocardia ailaonensis]|uniref:GAF and ANTAR domain-containing protein n=1 Tax=Pseudonocardia ailaonensis TaxID=367279 RepID=UPI0031CFFDEB
MARRLQAASGPHDTRELVTRIAVDTVHGCDHAAISLILRHGGIRTVAATDDIPGHVDVIQYEEHEGPCLNAISAHEIVRVDDLARETRWPNFSRRAIVETRIRSMLALRLFLKDDTLGALNLYSRKAAAFDDHSSAIGSVLAAHASIAMTTANEEEAAENLHHALRSSRQIGVAIGVLMNARQLTQDQAFAQLQHVSQRLNIKVRDLAEEVIRTGELPTPGSLDP